VIHSLYIRFVGIDELLARHVAHLFIRDPLVIFEELLEQADDDSDHFEVFCLIFTSIIYPSKIFLFILFYVN